MKNQTRNNGNIEPKASILDRIALHLSDGYSVMAISLMLRMALSTVYYWADRYFSEGPDGLKYKKAGRPLGSCKLLSPEQEASIIGLIVNNIPSDLEIYYATWTRRAVAELVYLKFQIKIAERTMGDYLKRWNMSPQKPIKQAYQRDPEKVKTWVSKTFPTIRKRAKKIGATIFFADESSVQTEDFNGRSFSPIGQTPVIKTTGSRLKLNIISALSQSGLMRYMTYNGSMNAILFINFLKQLIKSANGAMLFLVLDNLKTHHSKLVAEFLNVNKDKIQAFYLPAYSPELNPDEYLNNIIKQRYRLVPQPKNKEELASVVSIIMKGLQRNRELVQRIFLKEEIHYVSK